MSDTTPLERAQRTLTSTTLGTGEEPLRPFLTAYRPNDVSGDLWLQVADQAVELVLAAGPPSRARVANDISTVGGVVAHLLERGRPISLDEVLLDTTLQSFEAALTCGQAQRKKKRGILRRLRAVHRGLPWRATRRPDGARARDLVHHSHATALTATLDRARTDAVVGNAGAELLIAIVQAMRDSTAGGRSSAVPDGWATARHYAAGLGLDMTWPKLRAVITHEVLANHTPLALLISRHSLTRRELDLALTRVLEADPRPSKETRALLRGLDHGQARA